jgi:hypothetical protein
MLRHAMRFALLTVVAVVLAPATAAFAAVQEVNGNTLPQGQQAAGQCAAGERWVFVSPTANPNYNPLTKTTDSLGASSVAPPNANADQYGDGVTISIGTDPKRASFTVDESADPNTTITIGKVVVKSGNHFTIYTGADAAQGASLSSPATNPMMAISHAYVCYSLAQSPGQVVPETRFSILLPVTFLAAIAGVVALRRRLARR